jgi:hypothetical protein
MNRFAVCLAVLALTPLSAQAHRSFLLPSSTVLAQGEQTVTVDAARGNDLFYFNHNAMPVDNLHIFAPDNSEIAPAKIDRFRYRVVLDFVTAEQGTHRVAVLDQGLRAHWKTGDDNHRWTGSRADFASSVPADAEDLSVAEINNRIETFITTGAPTDLPISGSGLEARYAPHPNDLFAGEQATLTFLLDGKPATNLKITVIEGGTRYRNQADALTLTTNDAGEATLTWPRAGLYWINAGVRRDDAQAPATRSSASYTATVEVLPQ